MVDQLLTRKVIEQYHYSTTSHTLPNKTAHGIGSIKRCESSFGGNPRIQIEEEVSSAHAQTFVVERF